MYFSKNLSAPIGLSAPNVTILNSTAAEITWLPPACHNGILQYYQIRRVNSLNNVTVVVNNGLRLDLLMTDLVPYTKYLFQVAANTRGGKTWSASQTATTHEDGKAILN